MYCHVAALPFKYLEANVRIQQSEAAVTSQHCAWNRSQNRVEPAVLQNINFNQPKT